MTTRTSLPPGTLTPRPSVEVTEFTDALAAALRAFTEDVSYAVAISRTATLLRRKRATWFARRDLREAEATARRACARTAAFECHALAPCGTGDCKFADGPLAALTGVEAPGATVRPQATAGAPYSMERAVTALVAQESRHG